MKINYFTQLSGIFSRIEINDLKGRKVLIVKAISQITALISSRNKKGNKIMIIGNGGSAAIASHISVDLLKNAQISAMAFNDPCFLTCLSNDLGYETVFEKPLEKLAKNKDILIAISSSGKSKNILKAVKMARKKGCFLVTLSGFDTNNPLRRLGDINFYVPSHSYGYVEIAHLSLCHLIADELTRIKKNG